ncbi:MAG: EamA family transporter [Nitrososphaerales archaeon]
MISGNILGVILALFAAICFAGNRSFASKPLATSRPIVGTYISIAVGVFVSGVVVLADGQASAILFLTTVALILFALVGIFHFTVARQLSFVAIKNLGANETSAIVSTQILYSLVFAVLLLNEKVTLQIGAGSALILFGLLILDLRSGADKRKGSIKIGVLTALGTGLVYGLTPILIRSGLSLYHYYFAATFVAYVAAMLVFLVTTNPRKMCSEIKSLPRPALLSFVLAGVFAASAQLFRFWTLNIIPVVIVAPILASAPLFTLIFTRKLAYELEVFQPRIIISITMIVIGTIAVSLGSGISV